MAAQEKHGETQRNDSPKDPAYGGSKHANDLRGSEPDLARMVWVLQAQQSKCLWERRRLRARTTAQHPEKAKQKERARTRKRSSALAKCLLHHHGLVYLKTSTRGGMSIFLKVTTNWRAGCKKSACPVRREGRSFPSSLPLSKRSGRAKFHLGLVMETRCDKAGPSPNHAPRFWLRLRRVVSDAG